MALEFIIYSGNQTINRWTCLESDCGAVWNNGATSCPRCSSTNFREDDVGYKYGDIITLDYSPSDWSDSEKNTVVYMDDAEVIKLIAALGFESEDELWEYLDAPKVVDGVLQARKSYKVNCDFINTDGNFIHIKAENVVEK